MFTDKGLKKGLLDLLSINEFLKKPSSKWSSCKTYKHDKEAIKLLPVVNDPSERVPRMATEMHGQKSSK